MALTRPKYSQIYDSDFKNSARVATTGTVTLSGGAPSTVDDIALSVNDRVLVRAQTTVSQNGIYRVSVVGTGSNGTWVRTLDADTSTKLSPGSSLSIEEGTDNGGKLYRMTAPGPITLGSSDIIWTDVSGGGGATTGGTNGQVQFNLTNNLGGATYLYYNTATGRLTANAGTSSTSTSTGTIVVSGGVGVSGNVYCGQVYATNNGNGTNFAIGDDTWLGDINLANTTRLMGQQDATQAYLVFGNSNSSNYIGRSGTNPITVTGAFSVTGATVVGGNLVAGSGTASSSTTTGALVVNGGVGVSGNVVSTGTIFATGSADMSAFRSVGYNQRGGTGYHGFLDATNTYGSATNPNKFFRLSSDGSIEIINSAYNQNLFTLTDAGQLYLPQVISSTSTSTGTLRVGGGVGIGGSLNVGGDTTVAGNFTVTGNLTVNGTTTNINTTNLVVEDKNIIIADVTTPTDTTADGAGITVKGATDKTFTWVDATDAWTSSEDLNLLTGKQYEINGTSVLTATTLGSGVVNSSLTSLGNIGNLVATNSQTITGVVTNFSTANAVITGGSLNGTTVGATTHTTGRFTTVTATTVNAGTIGNSGATLTGTLSTAAQTNITSVGTLTSLSVSGALSAGSFTVPTAAQPNITSVGTLTGLTVSGAIVPNANLTINVGSTSAWFNTFYGVSTQAKYADLAENYQADAHYEPGTVLVFGGACEVTTTDQDHNTAVAGIVSTNPAHLMNGMLVGHGVVAVGLTGRLPCRVQGPVVKGDVLVTSTSPGVAQRIDNAKFLPGCVVGKALESINTNNIQTIEVVVGRF